MDSSMTHMVLLCHMFEEMIRAVNKPNTADRERREMRKKSENEATLLQWCRKKEEAEGKRKVVVQNANDNNIFTAALAALSRDAVIPSTGDCSTNNNNDQQRDKDVWIINHKLKLSV